MECGSRIDLTSPELTLLELVEGVRALPYGRPTGRSVAGMLRESRGTCSTKHRFLFDVLSHRFPDTDPTIVHRVYELKSDVAKELFGERVASTVPDDGIIDVHRYLEVTVRGTRIVIDATFPGRPWDGRTSLPLACAPGRDHFATGDPDEAKRRLELAHCDPLAREEFIRALVAKFG